MKDRKDKLDWINHWKQTGPILREIKRRELRNLSVAARQHQIENLLDIAEKFRKPRRDNGLVILRQRLNEIFEK